MVGFIGFVYPMSLSYFSQVKLDELVNPLKAIADYRTNITGVCKKDLVGVKFSLIDVQVRCFYKLLACSYISFQGLYLSFSSVEIIEENLGQRKDFGRP